MKGSQDNAQAADRIIGGAAFFKAKRSQSRRLACPNSDQIRRQTADDFLP
jgi:hypothetical protein